MIASGKKFRHCFSIKGKPERQLDVENMIQETKLTRTRSTTFVEWIDHHRLLLCFLSQQGGQKEKVKNEVEVWLSGNPKRVL
jgi:hypothetical protein